MRNHPLLAACSLLLLLVAACDAPPAAKAPDAEGVSAGASDGGAGEEPDAFPPATTPPPKRPEVVLVDEDGDGLDDRWEDEVARTFLPFLSKDPEDDCPLSAMLVRVRPHPYDDRLLHVVYDHLWERDCGLNGHVGDNEVFAATLDPELPPPEGVLALKAITHQSTPCEKVTSCGRCPGMTPCHVAVADGVTRPVVYSSRDKHAGYVDVGECTLLSCLDSCRLGPPAVVPLVNAGEPERPLTRDLTAAGLITEVNGWSEEALFHFDPWDPTISFGTAGVVADDLVDPAFETPACVPEDP